MSLGNNDIKYNNMCIDENIFSKVREYLKSIGFIKSGTNKFAAVCVGKDMNYPELSHKVSIKALGYKVRNTRDYRNVNKPFQIKLT